MHVVCVHTDTFSLSIDQRSFIPAIRTTEQTSEKIVDVISCYMAENESRDPEAKFKFTVFPSLTSTSLAVFERQGFDYRMEIRKQKTKSHERGW